MDTRDDEEESTADDDALLSSRQAQLEVFDTGDDLALPPRESARNRRRLYISHALSTWNSRVFEFGAYLFLAGIWAESLLPASVYALVRAGATALLSPWLGSYVDSIDRLTFIRLTIRTHYDPYGFTRH